MKNSAQYFTAPLLIATLMLSGCRTASKETDSEDPKDLAEKYNKAKATEKKEYEFLVEAADISLTVIELSKKAGKSSESQQIREIAKNLEADHNKMLEQIKKTAGEKMITIPIAMSKEGERTNEKVMKESGSEFDKHFCEEIVDEHKKAVEKYKSATEDIDDVQIKNWARTNLPLLRNHLDMAMTCQESYRNNENLDKISKSEKPGEKEQQSAPESKNQDDEQKKDEADKKKDRKNKKEDSDNK